MTWQDILFEECPDDHALRRALADVFSVLPRDVGLVRSSAASSGEARVRGVLTSVSGDFRCLLRVSMDGRVLNPDPIGGARRIASVIGIRAFISVASDNPYSGLLIDSSGAVGPALLDPDVEEDAGEYRLYRPAP